MVVKHSGDLGDFIAGLCAVKALANIHGPIDIRLGEDARFRRLSRDWIESVRPLLDAQPYVASLSMWDREEVDFDLDLWRETHNKARGYSIAKAHLTAALLSEHLVYEPWLSVFPNIVAPVVLNRTARYHSVDWVWKDAVERWGNEAVFIGTELEHKQFEAQHGRVPYHKCDNILEVAEVIAGAKIFMANQSMAAWCAEGLKQNLILENHVEWPRHLVSRPNRVDLWQADHLPPDALLKSCFPEYRPI